MNTVAFIFVGLIGFLIEYTIVSLFVNTFSSGVYLPRLLSFPLALLATWRLNRKFTYRVSGPPSWDEFFRYLQANGISQSFNLLFYTLGCSSLMGLNPLNALMLATSFSVFLSMCLYSGFVFKKTKD
jgi:putative flippase GtrA